ncbi:protein translocase subunit SecF [Candidatus Berkelbacteria bacterium]|nr:protein translocase subunit SecF [Candidatus Berkelbacteria bacterium]
MTILKHRRWLYLLSLLTLGGGVAAIAIFGVPKGIDFTGGTVVEVKCQITNIQLPITNECPKSTEELKKQIEGMVYTTGLELKSLQPVSTTQALLKFKPLDASQLTKLQDSILHPPSEPREDKLRLYSILRVETVGPAVSAALTKRAFLAVGLASLALIGYIAYAFRGLRAPLSPWRFGTTAVIAMVHDVGVVLGIFALLARFKGHVFEANSEFVAALLTVIGFSIHDTIVVFDRIRENTLRQGFGRQDDGGGLAPRSFSEVGEWFERIADFSLSQTLVRSITTSLTTLLSLLALVVFGGPSIVAFASALFIGILTGTYSSIFVATPLLVDWQYAIARRKSH